MCPRLSYKIYFWFPTRALDINRFLRGIADGTLPKGCGWSDGMKLFLVKAAAFLRERLTHMVSLISICWAQQVFLLFFETARAEACRFERLAVPNCAV